MFYIDKMTEIMKLVSIAFDSPKYLEGKILWDIKFVITIVITIKNNISSVLN